jgi:hypothetical protein
MLGLYAQIDRECLGLCQQNEAANGFPLESWLESVNTARKKSNFL